MLFIQKWPQFSQKLSESIACMLATFSMSVRKVFRCRFGCQEDCNGFATLINGRRHLIRKRGKSLKMFLFSEGQELRSHLGPDTKGTMKLSQILYCQNPNLTSTQRWGLT